MTQLKHLKILSFLLVLLVAVCGTNNISKGGTNLPTTAQANSAGKVSTQDVSVSSQSSEPKNENVIIQKTGSATIPQSKSIMSTTATSANLSASFVSPKPYAWVADQPLTVSWNVKNTTQKDVAFNLVLTDLTDSRKTYNTDLNINSNFPSAKLESGIYSWTIPATYISSQGYTLQENHKYELSLHTYVKWDGQGISPYKPFDCSTQFSVDSQKEIFLPQSVNLALH